MVVLFSEQDMLSFGKFVKSPERENLYELLNENSPNLNPADVTMVDLDLWVGSLTAEE